MVVGDNKRRRKQIEGLMAVVAEHEAKIAEELKKPQPNYERINTWKRHLNKAKRNIEKLEKKLP